MSSCERPEQSCVERTTSTLLYTLNHSGWWFIFSLIMATLVMKPNASTKLSKAKLFCIASLPDTTCHPVRDFRASDLEIPSSKTGFVYRNLCEVVRAKFLEQRNDVTNFAIIIKYKDATITNVLRCWQSHIRYSLK